MRTFHAIIAAIALVVFAVPAMAQTAPPEDTQARTAANLVNQVSAANFKAVAEHPALANNILSQAAASAASNILQTAAAGFARQQAIADASLAVALKAFNTMNAQESMALAKSMQADQASQMQQLMAAINSGGVMTKSMQTVPPVSVAPPAGGQ